MSRYFNDFGAMHGESLEHKAYKYVKKVKTKNGKTRYVYAKNIATNPQKYGAARMEELTPEELRRFKGKAHMDELWLDKVPQSRGVAIKNIVMDPKRKEITYYDNRYDVGRKGKKFTLSERNGELDKNANYTKRGENNLIRNNAEIAEWHNQEDRAKAKKKMQKDKKAFDKKYKQTRKAMKKHAN